MSDPTGSLPFGDDTDEAVSALLDGELAGFAADRGLAEAEARARLEGWSELGARLAELTAARDAMRSPAPPLSEHEQRRLVRGALDATRFRPRRRAWIGAAVAAAGLVVALGVGVLVSQGGDSSSRAVRSAAGGSASPRGDLGYVGDVTDGARLRALLEVGAQRDRARESVLGDGSANASPSIDDDDVERCAQKVAAELSGDPPVRFRATGRYAGAPVVVVGIVQGSRTIVFVVPPDDCTRILGSVSR